MDRIESQLAGKAVLVRVNVASPAGLQVARGYGIRATPSLLVLDAGGNVVYSHTGVPNLSAVIAAVRELE